MSAIALPASRRLALSSGAVESLKWIALAAMLVDHVNAVFYARELGTWATATGRVALPLFAVVLGYNLARPGVDLAGCLRRLVGFGLLAAVPYAFLFGLVDAWWPLNIMGTFAVAVGFLVLLEQRQHVAAWALFVLGGALVEYWWAGAGLVLAAYLWRDAGRWGPFVLALGALCFVNGNAWALLAVPVLWIIAHWSPTVPRAGRFFWWFYPVHLAVLAALTTLGVPHV